MELKYFVCTKEGRQAWGEERWAVRGKDQMSKKLLWKKKKSLATVLERDR